jgi:DinB superfamily
MTLETSLVDSALRNWRSNVDRVSKLFGDLSQEQLLQEVAPGKNRLIYLWGHLTAFNDALIPLLGFGSRTHPELDSMFISNPDRTVPTILSGEDLKIIWQETSEILWTGFSRLSVADWLQKHGAVSEEEFLREPHRNRFTVLLGRTAHIAYHVGQAKLSERVQT